MTRSAQLYTSMWCRVHLAQRFGPAAPGQRRTATAWRALGLLTVERPHSLWRRPGLALLPPLPAPVEHRPCSTTATAAAGFAASGGGKAPDFVTSRQLLRVACSSAIFMTSFGIVDNALMILSGDALDSFFGAKLGFSVMLSAGLGNTLSDLVGYYTGDAMEGLCKRLGIITPPKLTDAQMETQPVKSAQRHGGAMGLTIGCIIGMFPLLSLPFNRDGITPADLELYAEVFDGHRVPLEDIHALTKIATLKTAADGDVIIHAGQHVSSVFLLLDGFFSHADADGTPRLGFVAPRTWRANNQGSNEEFSGSSLKHMLNGTKLVDDLAFGKNVVKTGPYPTEVRARGPVRYYEADLEELTELCEELPGLERALRTLVGVEKRMNRDLKAKISAAALPMLDCLLHEVSADGTVGFRGWQAVEEFCAVHGLTDLQRHEALERLGLSATELQRGERASGDKDATTGKQ